MNILFVAATSQEITSKKINTQPNLITGLGMVNTAMYLTKELINNNFDLVINMGIAGAFSSTLKKGDVVEVIEDYFSEIGYEDDTNFCLFKEFDLKTKLINLIKIHENIDVNVSKSKIIENPGQLGLYPGDFMEGY